jgi:hypothetical protein
MRSVGHGSITAPHVMQCGVPSLAISNRRKSRTSVIVPTVERGFRDTDFWSIDTVGESPSMWSTFGFSIRPRNCRAYADRLSRNRR